MKNWDPLVSAPLLAMDTTPRALCYKLYVYYTGERIVSQATPTTTQGSGDPAFGVDKMVRSFTIMLDPP